MILQSSIILLPSFKFHLYLNSIMSEVLGVNIKNRFLISNAREILNLHFNIHIELFSQTLSTCKI